MARKTAIAPVLPDTGRGSWTHPSIPGLQLRGHSGGAVWTLRYRVSGKRVRDTLGRWPGLTAEAAVEAARTKIAATAVRSAAGANVLEDRARNRAESRAATLAELIDAYAAARLSEMKTGGEARRTITTVLRPLLPRRVSTLDSAAILSVTDKLRQTAPSSSDAALRYSKAMFGWAAQRGLSPNILSGVYVRQTVRRDRALSLLELGRIWNAAAAMGNGSDARALRFLIATAQRRGEVSGAYSAEIDRDATLWTIPATRMKNGLDHEVPLNGLALEAIGTLDGLLFPGRTRAPYAGWNKLKERLDRSSSVTDWRLHDLRRTCASLSAERGADAVVVDRILSHSGSSTLSGVGRVYQRSRFRDQKRAVMDLWGNIIGDAAARAAAINIIPMGDRTA